MRRLLPLLLLWFLAPAAIASEGGAAAALRWLARWAEESGAAEDAGGSPNETAKRRAVLCALALLLELHPEVDVVDPALRADVLRSTVRYAQGERRPGEDALETWNQALCALALVERAHRGASDGDALAALAARIQAGQRSDGGWGHGFRGSVAGYPSTLIAATSGSLLALGLVERLGMPVDEDCIDRGLALFDGVQARTGAFPYGGPLHRTDFEAGRTAGALVAMTALGRTDEEVLRCTADYLFVNVGAIPHGHGSTAFHVFQGALAFHTLGPEAWSRYDDVVLEGVRAAQRGDGSFDDVVEGSPDSHPAMGGELLNRAYRTALYAAALSVPRSHVAVSLREYGEDRLPVVVSRHEPNHCCLVWGRPLASAEHLFAWGGILAIVEESGRVAFRSAADGELLREVEHELDCDVALEVVEVEADEDRLVVRLREARADAFDELPAAARVLRVTEPPDARKGYLACYSLSDLRLLWNRELERDPWAVRFTGDAVLVLASGGGIDAYDATDGARVSCRPSNAPLLSCVLEGAPEGGAVVGTDANLQWIDAKGEPRWSRSVPAARDATPAVWTALLVDADGLWAGGSDGLVRRLDPRDGRTRSELALHAAIRGLARLPGQEGELLLALTDDGRVCAISDAALAWDVDLAGGHEWRGRARWLLDGDRLWIAHEGHGNVRSIDLKSGEIVAEYALPDDAAWTALDGHLIHAQGGRIWSLK